MQVDMAEAAESTASPPTRLNGISLGKEISLLQRPIAITKSAGLAVNGQSAPEGASPAELPPLVDPQPATPPIATVIDASSFFDATLMDAFARCAKDRAMLLRADAEMERFMHDSSLARLPMQPPHFAPINSFQRLLIHRLADTYKLLRLLEPASGPPGGPISVLVLQKTPQSLIPPLRLTDLELHLGVANGGLREPSDPPSDAVEQEEIIDDMFPPPPALPANFRIMTRQPGSEPGRPRSSQSVDDMGQVKKNMTLEEREAAYAEARQRIFAASADAEADRALASSEGLTTASCPETPLMRPKALRPSAPAFDPSVFSPVASTSRLPEQPEDSPESPSAPLWHHAADSVPTSPSSRPQNRSGSRSPSSASVSTIASSKTSTSTSSSLSDPLSRTSRSTSSRRISAQQQVLRFGAGSAAPPLFPPHHPQRPASPSPSTASVSTNSSRRSGGGRSVRLGPGLPDLEPMAGRGTYKARNAVARPPTPPPSRPNHPSLPEKPEWVNGAKRPESGQSSTTQSPVVSPPLSVAPAPPVVLQPLPPDPRFYAAPEYYATGYATAAAPPPHAYYVPAMVPAGYYAVPADGRPPPPVWDPYALAALYQQQMENMMGQLHMGPGGATNGDVPTIHLDEDAPRAARAPSMALFDPNTDSSSSMRRTGSSRGVSRPV